MNDRRDSSGRRGNRSLTFARESAANAALALRIDDAVVARIHTANAAIARSAIEAFRSRRALRSAYVVRTIAPNAFIMVVACRSDRQCAQELNERALRAFSGIRRRLTQKDLAPLRHGITRRARGTHRIGRASFTGFRDGIAEIRVAFHVVDTRLSNR